MWQPMGDGVLIRRLEPIEQARESKIIITDMATADAKMLIRKGLVLAVGPGKRDEDGERIEPDVQPGDVVLFNARWNDFANRDYQNKLPVGMEADIHLVQEADIAGRLNEKS
jgi:chaperonin GroES